MVLELERVSVVSGGQPYLYGVDLRLVPGAINVLLGPTQAGKTTLMRVMAGLDRPNEGRVLVDGQDVTGVSVRRRNLAMVYQQFINYPAMTVFENIASPLRLQRPTLPKSAGACTKSQPNCISIICLSGGPANCRADNSSAARSRVRS